MTAYTGSVYGLEPPPDFLDEYYAEEHDRIERDWPDEADF